MNKKVLIVDDDSFSLRLLEKYLKMSDYEVLKAADGRDALKLVLEHAPPILITDWTMPEMDGVELCKALRGHEGVRFIYVVMVTAHSDIGRLVEAFDAGADDFLPKPINRQELMARLHAAERIIHLEEALAKRSREITLLNAEMAMANEQLGVANEKLRRMATTDELTGLINRREAMTRLQQLWTQNERYGHSFCAMMLDIDHFKKINDTHGHAAGDAVLQEAARVMRKNTRSADIVCRIGGEEFLILCPGINAGGGLVCAEHVREAVEASRISVNGQRIHVTVSVGIAERTVELGTPDALLHEADEALYASKRNGRNRVTLAAAQLSSVAPVAPSATAAR
ncbi:MAG: hypothetical protein DCC65_09080 [Planctomycetota bacterium]|nr:MAG: hypothetical protein DCC65_09080 [Planctomycetota bacterium]